MKFDFAFHRTRTYKYYEVYLKRFKNKPSPILEIGSGIGLFLEACEKNGIDAVGLEYEIEGVQEATKKKLTAYQHDINNKIDFLDDSSFEAVFSNQVIEHIPNDAQINMVNEAYRVLKPGGQVLINSPCRHYQPAREDKYHVSLLTPSELKCMLENSGFIQCNLKFNICQDIPEIPAKELEKIWKKYQPDLFSKTAAVLACKPM